MASDTPEPLVQLADISGRGRALIASKAIFAGQILLQDTPILLYPAAPHKNLSSSFCSHCFRSLPIPNPNSATLCCPSCSNFALFCSPECHSIALASSHSQWVCKALGLLRSSNPSSELQTQANFLLGAYNLAEISPDDFNMLLSLQGEGTLDGETQMLHSFISAVMAEFPLKSFSRFSVELTAALLARDKRNAFGLMENSKECGERMVRAYGIYPRASFFNHDCLPNACRFDYIDKPGDGNNDIIIRALHDIAEGKEICLSYFPVNWKFADRQKRLLEDYGFVCECDRCIVEKTWREDDEEEDEKMALENEEEEQEFPHAYFFVRYLCPNEECGGTVAPLPPSQGTPSNIMECNVCGQLRTEEEFNRDEDEDDMVDD
ncbi:histone-lysine N-methyltransferase ASHR2 [Amborella trichopoda]|uniref:SET domain-containing protein n=1 Tax=Amborella trichopoda TaxID=13333 RepID=W1PFK2_AMBTC|nr:histone-lysine N-methyltransferase ASHR2 [Amborella trichopoda]ERN06421.1 hypothetical protein AMTR_s00016p00255770 [Amborella trichopoda]|eukprot:XP_006844746.1 histone-lysine N-methyltransferase ASHR2 [Amborella trichopoda]